MQINKKSLLKGFSWTAIDRLSSQIVIFLIGIVVARLVSPSEYGVLGIIMVFVNVSGVIVDSGLGSALIYFNELKKNDLYTTFTFNLLISIVIFVLLYLFAPFIESFYNLINLSTYLRVALLIIVFNSLLVVPTAILKVNMNFKALAISNVVSNIVSGILAVVMAYKGYGIWALIAQVLSRSFIQLIIVYVQCKWIPKIAYVKESFNRLFGYSVNLFGASCLTKITEEGLSFFVGKVFTPYSLGIYTRSQQFAALPSVSIGSIIMSVLFPSLSKIKDDEVKFRKLYDVTIEVLAMLSIPLFIGITIVATPLVKIILTDKWLDVVPVLQILCIGRIFFPLSNVTEQVINSKGRSDLFLRQQVIKMVTKLVLVVPALFMGLIWVAIADSFANFLAYFITNIVAKKCFDPKIFNQIATISIYLITNVFIGLATYFTINYLTLPIIQITMAVIMYLTLYLLFVFAFKRDLVMSFAK